MHPAAHAQAAKAVALLKSLSHEGRLQILCLLVDGEMNVTQLAEGATLDFAVGYRDVRRIRPRHSH